MNGWTNWDTWEAYNWIGSTDESLRLECLDQSANVIEGAASDVLKQHNSEIDLSIVNWQEIAEAMEENE